MAGRQIPPPHDDAFQAIATVGPWVNNADTKIGFLAAAMTVLTGALLRQRHNVDLLLHQGTHARGWVAIVFLALSAAAVILAGCWLFWGLRPRLTNRSPSRFAFPYLVTTDVQSLTDADPLTLRTEAWVQAKTLAEIVDKKYRCFQKGLTAAAVAGVTYVGWLLLMPPLHR